VHAENYSWRQTTAINLQTLLGFWLQNPLLFRTGILVLILIRVKEKREVRKQEWKEKENSRNREKRGSKKLSGAGTRYSTFDRELLAAFSAVRHFRFILEGRQFRLLTDHKPLVTSLCGFILVKIIIAFSLLRRRPCKIF